MNKLHNTSNPDKKLNKEQLDEFFDSSIFKLLAEPIRIEILKLLAINGPSDITEIASLFQQDRSVISRHLKLLYEGGLLIRTKESRSTIYQVDGLAFLQVMEHVVSDVKEMLAYCCDNLYHDLYKQGITYKQYMEENNSTDND